VRGIIYALWDTETNNLVAEHGNQRDALALVLCGIERNGPHDTDILSPDVKDESGHVTTISHGHELAVLAHRELAKARHTG
jgi:hypothetical protein